MQNPSGKANPKLRQKLVLASSSPRRTDLLKQAGIIHEVIPSQASEIAQHPDGPLELVMENAKRKALEVSKRYPDRLVLGADTIVSLGKRVFGKPRDLKEAHAMLGELSAKTHLVSTGVCLTHKLRDYCETRVVSSEVTFKKIDESVVERYFMEVDPMDKAGAYALQTRADLIVEDFRGSASNVIGLPMESLLAWLEELSLDRPQVIS